MRRLAFPAAVAVTLALAALLVWLWASDAHLIADCRDHAGQWDAERRVCIVPVTPAPRPRASPRS